MKAAVLFGGCLVLFGGSASAAGDAGAPQEQTGKAEGGAPDKGAAFTRRDADALPGAYFQLRPLWVRFQSVGFKASYISLNLRLYPKAGRRGDACLAVPAAVDALIRYFYRTPVTANIYQDVLNLKLSIRRVIAEAAGDDLFDAIDVLAAVEAPGKDEARLASLCY